MGIGKRIGAFLSGLSGGTPATTATTATATTTAAPSGGARYAPERDGEPDPGEVVWAWVPYEDDPSRGKDRPVLVLDADPDADGWVGLMLSSQDHDRDAEDEARWGRHWMDVGTGGWDSQVRPSEVRLDRLVRANPKLLELTRDGYLAKRGEVLLFAPDAIALDGLRSLGFRMLGEEAIDGLDVTVIRMQLPPGVRMRDAAATIEQVAPGIEWAPDHIYEQAG